MSMIPTKSFDGDVAIGRNVSIGGKAVSRGSAQVDHDLLVKGWLDAPNIKGVCKGLFRSSERLEEVYPHPHEGWIAFVGETLPARVYVAEHGTWKTTGKVGGDPTFDTTWHGEELEQHREDIDDLKITQATQNDTLNLVRNEIDQMIKRGDIVLRWFDSGHSIGLFTRNGSELAKISDVARFSDLDEPVSAIDELKSDLQYVQDNVTGLGTSWSMSLRNIDSRISSV